EGKVAAWRILVKTTNVSTGRHHHGLNSKHVRVRKDSFSVKLAAQGPTPVPPNHNTVQRGGQIVVGERLDIAPLRNVKYKGRPLFFTGWRSLPQGSHFSWL